MNQLIEMNNYLIKIFSINTLHELLGLTVAFVTMLSVLIILIRNVYKLKEELTIRFILNKNLKKLDKSLSSNIADLFLDRPSILGMLWMLLVTFFNANIIKAVLKMKKDKEEKKKLFNVTIVGMLLGNKTKHATISYLLLILGGVTHVIFSIVLSTSINNVLILFIAICIALIQVKQKILEFRIEKGYYGKNDYEAREMILFLLNHSDKSDFSDGDSLKDLFPEPIDPLKEGLKESIGWQHD